MQPVDVALPSAVPSGKRDRSLHLDHSRWVHRVETHCRLNKWLISDANDGQTFVDVSFHVEQKLVELRNWDRAAEYCKANPELKDVNEYLKTLTVPSPATYPRESAEYMVGKYLGFSGEHEHLRYTWLEN